MKIINEIYQYRELLKANIKKEIRGKYKGSFLGVLWSFVNPLLMTLVYAIVFPFLLKSTMPHYLIYLVIGILAWSWVTNVISQGTTVFLANSGIIKKVYFPREILPLSIVISGCINFLISLIIVFIFLIFSGIGISWHIIFLPLIIFVQLILLLLIILFTGSINVYIRDAEHIINFFVQMIFYATPILYSLDMFPAKIQSILKLNPFVTIINSYRDILFYQKMPDFTALLIVFGICLIFLIISYLIFKKLEKGFAEEL